MRNNFIYLIKDWRHRNPRSIVFAVLRVPVLICTPLLTALIPKLILDCIARQATLREFTILVGVFSLLLASLRWLDPFLQSKINWAAQQFRMDCAVQMMQKLLYVDFEILSQPETEQKLNAARQFAFEGRLSDSQYFYETLTQFCSNFFGIFAYLVLLALIHPGLLGLLVLSGIAELLLLYRRNHQKNTYKDSVIEIFSKADVMYQTASDVHAGKDVRVYNVGRWFAEHFAGLLDKLICTNGHYIRQSISVFALRGLGLLLREGFGYAFLFYLLWRQQLSVANFVLAFGVVSGVSSWLTGIVQQADRLSSMCDSCGRFRMFLDLSETKINIKQTAQSLIAFQDVSFTYPGAIKSALREINLTIQPGERVAIVGENGAGKSTLINLICGLYQPTTGTMMRSDTVSAVFQDSFFLPMSIKANIALSKQIDHEKIMECLQKVGLSEKIYSLPQGVESKMISEVHDDAVGFSGGEKQRLLLARALYHDAPVLLLDEPTAALDPLVEERLYHSYDELIQDKTVVFVSHRLASTQFCDRIILMQEGKIIEQGSHYELMQNHGHYWRMFEAQRMDYCAGEVIAFA